MNLLALCTLVLFWLASIVPAWAQSRELDLRHSPGFHADRNYFSPEPFEYFDTLSGNLVLTFTDLTLPGNAGRSLRFQRTYNYRPIRPDDNGFAGPRFPQFLDAPKWGFGFPGVVMRVVEPDGWPLTWPPFEYSFQDDPQHTCQPETTGCGDDQYRVWVTTPRFIMADGGVHRTVYTQTPNAAQRDTLYWVRSNQFYEYHRITKTLYMPDGTVCHYDAEGRLIDFEDPFGSRVELEWQTTAQPPQLIVRQQLGTQQTPQERNVTFVLDPQTLQPIRMEYLGRTWQYHYQVYTNVQQLSAVHPPVGRPWEFTYGSSGWPLTTVTTPNRGRITYTYGNFDYPAECPPTSDATQVALTQRLSEGPSGTAGGTWTIQPIRLGTCDLIFRMRIITTPSQTRVTYHYNDAAPGMDPAREVVAGAISLYVREVTDQSGPLESETRSYQEIPIADHTATSNPVLRRLWGSYEIDQRTITRSGQTYATRYVYGQNDFGDFHRPNRIEEEGAGGGSRITARNYSHPSPSIGSRFLVGLLQREDVVVGSESFKRFWAHDPATGFLSTQTIHGVTSTFTTDGLGNVASLIRGATPPTYFAYRWGEVERIETPEYVVTREISG